ncbi:hypothetical protein DFH07DRAFT_797692 [Mycena maculata]|uniref:F-box domain-containing protein n=1 Tax=Mycena maculata TaxID=230809 RepID=A0AAD7K1Z4_9AGAR|nr:hypothetical protein DFH07DRAFT_797692 [Mycena maculata]
MDHVIQVRSKEPQRRLVANGVIRDLSSSTFLLYSPNAPSAMDAITLDSVLLGQSSTPGGTTSFESQAKRLIQETEANIQRIESQIRDLESIRDRERALVAILKIIIAPIRKLPPELLVEIFLHDAWDLKHALRISQVCVLWKELASKTPALWTGELRLDITNHCTDYSAAMQGWLERSSPLSIPISIFPSLSSSPSGYSPSMVNAIISVAPRWRSFRLYGTLPQLSTLTMDTLTMLEEVELIHGETGYQQQPTWAFIAAPRLRRVYLCVPDTTWYPMPWSQLTQLHLTHSEPQACVGILAQCANMVSAEISTHPWEHSPPSAITTLERLEDLHIIFKPLSGNNIAPFFQRLSLPILKTLHLDLYDLRWSSGVKWSPATTDAFIQFQVRSPALQDLTLRQCDLEWEDLHRILRHASALTKLSLQSCERCIDDNLLRALKYSDRDAVHLVPKLSTFIMDEGGTSSLTEECLEETLRSRWWSAEALQALASPPAVARWQHIWCGYRLCREFLRMVEDELEREALDAEFSG